MKVKQSCKIMQMRLTWSKCNPTIMYGFAASLCTASRKSTWPMSGKITVKRDKPCLRWWLHTLLTWCAKCRHLYCRVNATKGYERGQRLLPHRWWCLLVEVPGLRQTGWSSVTSARTETPPSRDCVPSGHVTPVMVIKVMIKKKHSQHKVPAQLHHQHNILQIYAAFQCKGWNLAKAVPCVRAPGLSTGLLSYTAMFSGPLRIHKGAAKCNLTGLQCRPWRMQSLTRGVATTCLAGGTKSEWAFVAI